MFSLLEKYCNIPSPSGSEEKMRQEILSDIKGFATKVEVDNLGNIIAFKKGKKTPKKKIMLDAHMDEIGFMIIGVDEDGLLRFNNLGGIDSKVIFGKRVKINDIYGVIGGAPVHLLDGDNRKKVQNVDNLRIDIGAKNQEDAMKKVKIGDVATFDTEFLDLGENIGARGLDDKVGVAILVDLIKSDLEYDMYFSFSVQEEIGCRGATVTSYSISPDCAITVEATTAADIFGVPQEKTVCVLGGGAALSLMDNGTLYDKNLVHSVLDLAKKNNIPAQLKTAVAGGTNASVIHKSKNGVKTVNIALPTRYIHSAYCVANKSDVTSLKNLVLCVSSAFANGEI